MKIVIDIPEKMYDLIKRGLYDYGDMNLIIKNGKVLSKKHGRLIDESCIKNFAFDIISNNAITDAPTIIEADTESEGK